MNIKLMRDESVKGATVIFGDTNNRFHSDLTAILEDYIAPDNPEEGEHNNHFEFWESEMVAGTICRAFMCCLWFLSACT